MDFEKKIKNLGGVDILQKATDEISPLIAALPKNLVDFIKKYGFGVFNEDVIFRSIESISDTDDDNTEPITIIYGLGEGENSVLQVREDFEEQIPENYFVFAEASPGNQLCFNVDDNKIYLWLHDDDTDYPYFYLVANAFDDFFESLSVSEAKVSDDDIEEEWFADDF